MPEQKPHSKYIVWEPFLLAAMMVVGMIIGNKMEFYHQKEESVEVSPTVRSTGEVEQLLRFIESKYVEDVDGQELTQTAIDAILNQLDPHTQYLSPRLRAELEEDMNGAYQGIGVEEIRLGDSLFVVSTSQGSPADIAGIIPGDRIIAVHDSILITSEMSDDSLATILRGDGISDLRLTIIRNERDTIILEMGRDEIPLPAIDLAEMINDSIGLVKVNRFSNDVYREFMQAVEELANDGMDDLIIDLRGNPGGYLQESVKMLSQLVEEKEALLVYTEGAHSKRTDYKSTGRLFYEIDDVILLTDAGSASASEIMAGALQDLDRGLVVGRRTFGKGLVQEQYRLTTGAALRLTTARYFTPSGRLIQRDYSDLDHYSDETYNRDATGENIDEDLIPILDSTEHFTNAGRIVYGGGGIVPDVFVPKQNPFSASDWPHIAFFIQAYLIQHLNEFDNVPAELEEYTSNYEVSDDLLLKVTNYVEREWPIERLTSYQGQKTLKAYTKAYLAKLKYNSSEAYFKSLRQEDNVINEAVELIKSNKVGPLLSEIQASIRE